MYDLFALFISKLFIWKQIYGNILSHIMCIIEFKNYVIILKLSTCIFIFYFIDIGFYNTHIFKFLFVLMDLIYM